MAKDLIDISIDIEVKDAIKNLGKVEREIDGLASSTRNSTSGMASSISSLFMPLAGLATSFASVASVMNFGSATIELQLLSETLGMSATRVSQLGMAAESVGASESSIRDALSALQQLNTEAKYGEGALVEVNSKYRVNISASGNPEEQLKSVSDALMRLKDPAKQVDLVNALGIDPMLIPLLRQGGEALSDMANMQFRGVTTEADIKNAKALQKALHSLKSLFLEISSILLTVLSPAFKVLSTVTLSVFDFLRENLYLVYIGIGLLLPQILALGYAFVTAGASSAMALGKMLVGQTALMASTILLTIKAIALGIANMFAFLPIYAIILGVIAVVAGLSLAFMYVWKKVKEGVPILNAIKSLFTYVFSSIMIGVDAVVGVFSALWGIIKDVALMVDKIFGGKVASFVLKLFGKGDIEGIGTEGLAKKIAPDTYMRDLGLNSSRQITNHSSSRVYSSMDSSNSNNSSNVTNNITVRSTSEAQNFISKTIAVDNQRGRM